MHTSRASYLLYMLYVGKPRDCLESCELSSELLISRFVSPILGTLHSPLYNPFEDLRVKLMFALFTAFPISAGLGQVGTDCNGGRHTRAAFNQSLAKGLHGGIEKPKARSAEMGSTHACCYCTYVENCDDGGNQCPV